MPAAAIVQARTMAVSRKPAVNRKRIREFPFTKAVMRFAAVHWALRSAALPSMQAMAIAAYVGARTFHRSFPVMTLQGSLSGLVR